MASVHDILKALEAKANPENVKGMARYGMTAEKRLGVSVPDMRKIAKSAGKDHALALELWRTGVPEARIVAAMVAEPDRLTETEMEDWVKDINSWDVCDQACMNLFEKTPLAWKKIIDWSVREEEFVKRTAFSLLACIAWHNKTTGNDEFVRYFPVIKEGATDERNFVKKSVSWALRSIGKRNPTLNRAAIDLAAEIGGTDSKAARWIASDVTRDLTSEAVKRKLAKKK
jgi:3-methyladenine DNA glycosylase AlkD